MISIFRLWVFTFSLFCSFSLFGLGAVEGFGSLDPSFDPDLDGPVDEIRILYDGRLLILGSFTAVDGVGRPGLAILEIDGSLDESFDPGAGANGEIHCIEFVHFRIYVGGDFTEFNGVSVPYFVQLDFTGAVSAEFSPGVGPNASVLTIASGRRPFESQGASSRAVILGGEFSEYGGEDVGFLTMVELSGEPLRSTPSVDFWLSRFRSESSVSLVRSNNSEIWVAGTYLKSQVEEIEVLFEFSTLNNTVAPHPVNGTIRELGILKPALGNNGAQEFKIVLSGDFTEVKEVPCPGLAILGASFRGPTSLVTVPDFPMPSSSISAIEGVKVDPVGRGQFPGLRFLLGGSYGMSEQLPSQGFTIWRHEENSRTIGEDSNSFPEPGVDVGVGANGEVRAVATDGEDRFYVGGSFTEYGGVAREYLARVHGSQGAPPPPPSQYLEGYVPGPGQVVLRWLGSEKQSSFDVERSSDGGVTWELAATVATELVILDGENLGTTSYRVRGRNLNGFSMPSEVISLDVSEVRNPSGGVWDFTFSDSVPEDLDFRKAGFLPDGRLLVLGNGLEIEGNFYGELVGLSKDGLLAGDFTVEGTISPSDRVSDFEFLRGGQLLIAGNFETVGGHQSAGVARLNGDGTVDTTFTMASPFSGRVLEIGVYPGGRIGMIGFFSEVGGVAAGSFAIVEENGNLPLGVVFPAEFRVTGQEFVAGLEDALYLYYGGDFGQQSLDGPVVRFLPDGTPDSLFEVGSLGFSISEFSLDRRKRVLVAGFGGAVGPGRLPLKRLFSDGTVDESFEPPMVPNVRASAVVAVRELADGRILVMGDFWNLAGAGISHVALLLPNGDLDPSFSPPQAVGGAPVQYFRISPDAELLVRNDGEVFLLRSSREREDYDHLKFQVELQSPYEVWRQSVGLSEDGVDADGDGFSDLLEYALDSSPLDASDQPSLGIHHGADFQAEVGFPRPDVDYQFERSLDLQSWGTEGLEVVTEGNVLKARLIANEAAVGFVRVRVSLSE
jgi:hypothetical protein